MTGVTGELREGVQWIRLERAERMNAYDEDMLEAMLELIAQAPRDAPIAMTGSGRAFCSGGYLANLAEADENDLRRMFYGSLRLFDTLRAHPAPVFAAVNGAAVGGGNELVVACDLAIAAESAFFGQTGPRIGSAPVLGGANMLAIGVGDKRAKEISLLCRRYTAAQALDMGWINAVVPDAELEDEVMRWAHELRSMSPRYLEIAKISSNVWWNHCRESYVSGLGMLVQAIGSADMLEGANAFLEKRKPHYPRSTDATA
jgi:2-ketocyclohexanecarboxyl-CoA hydrolase